MAKRPKWNKLTEYVEIDDIVMITYVTDEIGNWLNGRVIELQPDKDGQVSKGLTTVNKPIDFLGYHKDTNVISSKEKIKKEKIRSI
uniref:DUF5641 domain-containing protein n=1 Tax=Anopheles epiroticus TaxID=199890 RepID=A0A182PWR5_9DIPT